MTTSISKIADSFPIKTLTPISTSTSKPTYATITKAQTQLNGNAMSIPSDGGDGILGHIALTVSAAAYNGLSAGNVPFVPPANPGAAPVHPPNPTAPQIAEVNRQWKEDRTTYRTYHDVDKALRNQVIEAVDPSYIRSLYNTTTGYGNLTCRQLLEHLWLQYGTIMQDELDANTTSMMQPWSPPTPIETLFTQLDEGAIFAIAGGEPIAPATIVRIGYNIMEANGLFDTACHKWRTEFTAPNKTLDAFKTHFLAADKDRSRNMTSGNSGFKGANKATTSPTALDAVIANASTSYCWTHGSSKNAKHTSGTCENKAEGHQDDATINNKKGGSTKVWGPKK